MGEFLFVFLIVGIVVVCAFTPICNSFFTSSSSAAKAVGVKQSADKAAAGLVVPEDSVLKRHFLAQLQSEIEGALFPRPTDSMLQRHYDTLVAAEVESRLYRG